MDRKRVMACLSCLDVGGCGEQQTSWGESSIQGLMLATKGISVESEPYTIKLGRVMIRESTAKPHADLRLANDVDAALKPFQLIDADGDRLYEYTIT